MMQTRPFAMKGHTTLFFKLSAGWHQFRLLLANLTRLLRGFFLQSMQNVVSKLFTLEQTHQEIFFRFTTALRFL
jgi:hypothetical protein